MLFRVISFQIPQGQSSNDSKDKFNDLTIMFQIPQGQSSNHRKLFRDYPCTEFQIPQGQSSNIRRKGSIMSKDSFKSHRDKVQMLATNITNAPTLSVFQIPQGQSSNESWGLQSLADMVVSNPIGTKFKFFNCNCINSFSMFQIPQGQSSNLCY